MMRNELVHHKMMDMRERENSKSEYTSKNMIKAKNNRKTSPTYDIISTLMEHTNKRISGHTQNSMGNAIRPYLSGDDYDNDDDDDDKRQSKPNR